MTETDDAPEIRAPFTPEQVEALRAWQACPWTHSLTCSGGSLEDCISGFADVAMLVYPEGLACPECQRTQLTVPVMCFGPLPPSATEALGFAPTALPLAIRSAVRNDDDEVVLQFNRRPTDEEMDGIAHLPPSPALAADLNVLIGRSQLLEIAVRLFRFHVLSGLVTAEGPAFSRWLRDWIDGKNHGPLGGAMLWPLGLTNTARLLREWGFEPVQDGPHRYVARAPKPKDGETVQ